MSDGMRDGLPGSHEGEMLISYRGRSSPLSPERLPIGTRIRFLATITKYATEEHPGRLYCVEGEGGVVTGHEPPHGHMVKWDGRDASFGAVLGAEESK